MEKKIHGTQILTWVCVLMLLAMIVVTFLPSWTCEVTERIDGEKVTYTQVSSISKFSWFPKDHKDLQKQFEKSSGLELNVNDEVTMPVLLLLLGVAASAFALVNPRSIIAPAAATLLGAFSIYSYLTSAFLRTAANWNTNLIVSIAATSVSVVCVALYFVFKAVEKKAKKVQA